MTELKKDFLRKMAGFRKSDLSLARQLELDAYQRKYEWEWVMLALSKQSLEDWEKWGFVLFNKPDFIREVNGLVEAFEKINDDDIIKDKNKKVVKGKPKFSYSEQILQRQYEKLISGANMTHNGTEEAREILAMIQATKKSLDEMTEKERLVVATSTLVRVPKTAL